MTALTIAALSIGIIDAVLTIIVMHRQKADEIKIEFDHRELAAEIVKRHAEEKLLAHKAEMNTPAEWQSHRDHGVWGDR